MTADWQVFPTAPWNYALDLDPTNPARAIGVREDDTSNSGRQDEIGTAHPSAPGPSPAVGRNDEPRDVKSVFSRQSPPVTLEVRARKLPAWQADDGAANPLPLSPVAADQPEETLTLIPYAAAKLRITAFPQAGKLTAEN
jgi:uncharacterized protein